MDIPYTQQFSVVQTPLRALLPIIRQHAGDRAGLRRAIASAFFKKKATPEKIAGNTLIALHAHRIIETDGSLTEFGKALVRLSPDAAQIEIAKNILRNLGGFQIVETLREMKSGGQKPSLRSVPVELGHRGLKASRNSSDLSGVKGWLTAAGVLNGWEVNGERYSKVMGAEVQMLEAFKGLTPAQIIFLEATLALNVREFTKYTSIVRHAETQSSGGFSFNAKMMEKEIIQPLERIGLIHVRRPQKRGRGGKPADVRPTEKFETAVAIPMLQSLLKNVGAAEIRKIRSTPMSSLVGDIRQKTDANRRGNALEMLAIRFGQLLGLQSDGRRKTDDHITAGGEVDAVMHSRQLTFCRWQIQCKATDSITYEMLAKEVGVAVVSLASVLLIVSTGTLTPGAAKYRTHITKKTALNLVIIDGPLLDEIIADPSRIGQILNAQAYEAMQAKEQVLPLIPLRAS